MTDLAVPMNAHFPQRNQRVTLIVFLSVPVLIAILVFLFLKQMYLDQQQGMTLVKHSYDVREQLLELRNDLIQSETGQNIFLVMGSRSYLQPSSFAESDAFVRLAYLSVLLADRQGQWARLNRLRPLIEKMLAENREAVLSKATGQSARVLQPQDSLLPEEIGGLIREMQADEDQVLSLRQKTTQSDVDARATVSTVLLTVTAAAILGAWVLLLRIRQLQTIITICAWTQRVNFNGKWMRMEDFLWNRFRVKVSHGISEQAFEGVVGMVGKKLTISGDRAVAFGDVKPQLDGASGS
jgi:CHASE3 domain sensor protein